MSDAIGPEALSILAIAMLVFGLGCGAVRQAVPGVVQHVLVGPRKFAPLVRSQLHAI